MTKARLVVYTHHSARVNSGAWLRLIGESNEFVRLQQRRALACGTRAAEILRATHRQRLHARRSNFDHFGRRKVQILALSIHKMFAHVGNEKCADIA